MSNYIPSIGMEVHVELLTKSKMFCRCEVAFGGEPNTRVCPVCLGHPGTLPVPNRHAVELVLKTALALNCKIAMNSIFHRKNYFYPDLPKGYQISQYGETNPLGYDGWIEIPTKEGKTKRIKIQRVHLEEDTGKLMHLPSGGSGVDFNRSSLPLMEIVSAFPPDIESAEEAKEYLVQLRQILLYLGVSDGKMEEGSMRCEPNISVRPASTDQFGTKTELKNLNSFRSVQLGIDYEVERQIALLEQNQPVLHETRGWNEVEEKSFAMRTKEHAHDYRYFPDPDLVPMEFQQNYIDSLRSSLPELPLYKSQRYTKDYGLSTYDANLLVSDLGWSKYFEQALELGGDPKLVCNWMSSDLAKMINETGQNILEIKTKPEHLIELISLIHSGKISGKIAKKVLATNFETGKKPSTLVDELGLVQISDSSAIEEFVASVLNENEEVVNRYKSGQHSVMGFLVGETMKKSKGQANPQLVQQIVREKLGV